MKNEEKQLFRSLCSFKSEFFDEKLLEFATPTVLGHLFFNRMGAVAYGTLQKHGLLGRVNREFRSSLQGVYEQNIERNKSFFTCVRYVFDILLGCDCKYAMLKGAYLCGHYPIGYRTSNDIDLLIMPEHVTEVGNVLVAEGFKQGNIRNGEFIPATRKEIIESKMMRGETVPYIKQMDLPYMKYLEVDVNFSLDYKNSDIESMKVMLDRVIETEVNGISVQTLDSYDFFVHLCSHLYKEATTLPWIEMMRDMTLYKYCDIYMIIDTMSEADMLGMFARAQELGMGKICAFSILQTAELFDLQNQFCVDVAKTILREDPCFIYKVTSPKNKKTFVYRETSALERLFSDNRKGLLKEK